MKLSEKLVYLRKQKNATQQQIADSLHLSRQTISKWENGSVMPSDENMQRLADYYGITAAELLSEENPIPAKKKFQIHPYIKYAGIALIVLLCFYAMFSKKQYLNIRDLSFSQIGEIQSAELIKQDEKEMTIEIIFELDEDKENTYYSVSNGKDIWIEMHPLDHKRKIQFTVPKSLFQNNNRNIMFAISFRDETDSYIIRGGQCMIEIAEYVN